MGIKASVCVCVCPADTDGQFPKEYLLSPPHTSKSLIFLKKIFDRPILPQKINENHRI